VVIQLQITTVQRRLGKDAQQKTVGRDTDKALLYHRRVRRWGKEKLVFRSPNVLERERGRPKDRTL